MKKLLLKLMSIKKNVYNVLSINQRNLRYIYPNNSRKDFPIANNKMLAKSILEEHGVPVPRTYLSYKYFFELRNLEVDLKRLESFVIKPAQGRAGGGIIVVDHRDGDRWVSAGGRRYDLAELRKHISDIVFGIHSFSMADEAMIEEKVIPHPFVQKISSLGLPDIRVILHLHEPVLAMMRIPTHASDGKANLHQGAIGVGLDVVSGVTTHAIHDGEPLTHHPDTGVSLIGIQLPFWQQIIDYSRQAAEMVPLKYLGVDIVLSEAGPLMLEINARPGIEIQNANLTGMRPILEAIEAHE